MRSIDRIDIKKRWPIPPTVKLLLMLLVIFGFIMHNCWKKTQGKSLPISDIEITELTRVSADVAFVVANPHNLELKKAVLIQIFTKSGELIASKISSITMPAKTKKRYLKVLQKFNFPVDDPESVGDVTIEWYK